ncbi:MAG: hypothetical protein BAJALOKI3v1_130011 [Promethearchaeota archaeon]|jgi:hypothetical protein|nr:MAG: hypothetical protein BAJALOKI3v1_130011 [Candidatus Lokiarchaeota archaeon]
MDLERAKKIELSDKEKFDSYFQKYPPEISEFTFTNLFAWQNYYHSLYIENEDHLIVFSNDFLGKWKSSKKNSDDVLFFFPPIGKNPEQVILDLFTKLPKCEIHRVPESLISILQDMEEFKKLNLAIEEDRANWDYMYDKEDLIALEGNKYRSKRRLLERFLEQYDYEFHLVTEDWLEKCRSLQNKWCIINECQSNEDLEQEQIAIDRFLDHYTDLDYNGGLLLVDGKPAGYTFGEMLNEDTNVIHIEKAHTYYEGSYQAINNMFLKNCCDENAKFVNREQDLGVPGLRKAKESYHPKYMVKKYIVYQKQA